MGKTRQIMIAALLMLLALICIPSGGQLAQGAVSDQSRNTAYKVVVVKRGDSLWKIAQTHCPNRNTREVVDEMYRLNQIGQYIYAGNELKVPADIPQTSRPSAAASRGLVGRELACIATAYTHTGYRTATMTWPQERRTIAVDPTVIPLKSKVYVTCPTWPSINGTYIAEDTGGFIKGNRVDMFMNSRDQAILWGRRTVTIRILE